MHSLDRLMAAIPCRLHDPPQAVPQGARGEQERIMAINDDWLEDVRRWYYGGNPPAAEAEADGTAPPADLGYEAAHPALQARHWPDAPVARTEQPR